MAKNRYYKGVWSNGKEIIDLDKWNSDIEERALESCCFGDGYCPDEIYYVTEKGTMIHKYEERNLEDYFVDIGPIYSNKKGYKILGKNFKRIKEQGEINPSLALYNKCWEERTKKQQNDKKNKQ